MYGEIYIDLVFVTNLLLDYFLLRLVGILFKCQTGKLRILAGALFGAISACIILLLPVEEDAFLMTFTLHGVCAMGMIRIGYGLKKYGLLVKGMIMLYLSAFLWGGLWEIIHREHSMTLIVFFIS